MKQLSILKTKASSGVIAACVAVSACFTAYPVYAKGLDRARNVMKTIQEDLSKIIPVVAVTILMCLAIGYAGRFIGKETFVRWAIGVIIAGSAAPITKLLFD